MLFIKPQVANQKHLDLEISSMQSHEMLLIKLLSLMVLCFFVI
jgi:hypothetical protein